MATAIVRSVPASLRALREHYGRLNNAQVREYYRASHSAELPALRDHTADVLRAHPSLLYWRDLVCEPDDGLGYIDDCVENHGDGFTEAQFGALTADLAYVVNVATHTKDVLDAAQRTPGDGLDVDMLTEIYRKVHGSREAALQFGRRQVSGTAELLERMNQLPRDLHEGTIPEFTPIAITDLSESLGTYYAQRAHQAFPLH